MGTNGNKHSRKTTRVSNVGQTGDNLIPMVPMKNLPKNSRNLASVSTNQPGSRFRGAETQQLQLIN